MKLGGIHYYFGPNPDAGLTEAEKEAQHRIRPSEGPREVIPGLLSIGDKSRRKILDANRLPAKLRNASINNREDVEKLAKLTYDRGRFYQGTTFSEAHRWRNEDMDPSKKTTSSAVKRAEQPEFASGLSGVQARNRGGPIRLNTNRATISGALPG